MFVVDGVCKLLLVGGVGAAKSSDDNDDDNADTLCVYDDENDNENNLTPVAHRESVVQMRVTPVLYVKTPL